MEPEKDIKRDLR